MYRSMPPIFRQHTLLYLLTITSFGIAIGALWEITEWSAGKILAPDVIGSIDDTVVDLIMDTLGSGLAAIISLWVLQKWTDSGQGGTDREKLFEPLAWSTDAKRYRLDRSYFKCRRDP